VQRPAAIEELEHQQRKGSLKRVLSGHTQ